MARLEVVVEVDGSLPDADDGVHVSGTVRTEDGAIEPFVGWIGLLALVQRALIIGAP